MNWIKLRDIYKTMVNLDRAIAIYEPEKRKYNYNLCMLFSDRERPEGILEFEYPVKEDVDHDYQRILKTCIKTRTERPKT